MLYFLIFCTTFALIGFTVKKILSKRNLNQSSSFFPQNPETVKNNDTSPLKISDEGSKDLPEILPSLNGQKPLETVIEKPKEENVISLHNQEITENDYDFPLEALCDEADNLPEILPLKNKRKILEKALEKGRQGEEWVNNILENLNKDYLHDVFLEKNGKITQIDHIVKYRWGILLIETKNYSGHLSGTMEKIFWRPFPGSKIIKKIHSPLHQNDYHMGFMKEITGLNENILSLVVFVGDAIITSNLINLPEVKTKSKLSYFLKGLDWKQNRPKVPWISEDTLNKAWDILQRAKAENSTLRESHLKALRSSFSQKIKKTRKRKSGHSSASSI